MEEQQKNYRVESDKGLIGEYVTETAAKGAAGAAKARGHKEIEIIDLSIGRAKAAAKAAFYEARRLKNVAIAEQNRESAAVTRLISGLWLNALGNRIINPNSPISEVRQRETRELVDALEIDRILTNRAVAALNPKPAKVVFKDSRKSRKAHA